MFAAMAWLAVCAAAVAVPVLGLFSVSRLRSPVEIESSYVALVAGQAFFLVFIWPLFERGAGGSILGVGVRLAGMLILSVPLVFLTLRFSEVVLGDVIWSQLLLVFIGVGAGTLVRLPGSVSWYYPGAFLL